MTDLAEADEHVLKHVPDAENEVHELAGFSDLGRARVTPIVTLPADAALGIVAALAGVVRAGHASEDLLRSDSSGITRAQMFEEGAVLMTAPPFEGYPADRYLMDFYDVTERDICSRMHMHIGMRFVRMMTGPSTEIRVSTLSPAVINGSGPGAPELKTFTDDLLDADTGRRSPRYNVVVPECSWVDMQIPRGTSHQFNAIGPHAVIDTIHPEESIEIFREKATRINMMAQTIFLEEDHASSEECRIPDDV